MLAGGNHATKSALQSMTAVLLVGGLGTRLRPAVSSVPKPLASVGDRPFLELLVMQLREQNICRLVMCTCHQADQIKEKFGDGRKFGVRIQYSDEPCPLGTAGAIRLARGLLSGDSEFLVLNGDSFLDLDFGHLIQTHRERGAIMTMAVTRIRNAARYGTVQVSEAGRVTAFAEKTGQESPALINAGVYVFSRRVLDYIPEGRSSLERDVLPSLLDQGIFAVEHKGIFIDIGTPEDYARAQAISEHLSRAASERKETRST